jgi:hypothetical protein
MDYITAPLYVNVLIILLSIQNSPIIIGLFNIILNFIQLLLVFKISGKIFDVDRAKTVIIIYVFYLSTLGLVMMNFTELLFMVLMLSSIYFYMKKSIYTLLICGILVGASLAVRPIGWALIAAYILNYFWIRKSIVIKLKELSFIGLGIVLFVGLFGFFTLSNFGRFIYTANDGPLNLLIGANKNASGGYNAKVFEQGNAGYIEHPELMTYYEKENYWLGKAEEYIISHPVKWLSIFPMKIVYTFAWDDFSIHKLLTFDDWYLYKIAKSIFMKNTGELLGNKPVILKVFYFLLLIIHHLYYFSLIILFIYVMLKFYKDFIKNDMLRLFLLFILAGVVILLLTFGNTRFKYPYIITMMIFISPVVFAFLRNNFAGSKNVMFN